MTRLSNNLDRWSSTGQGNQLHAMTETLDTAEVTALTGRRERAKQCSWLEINGVPFRRVGERVIVSREHVRMWLAGATFAVSSGPRLDLVR